MVTDGESFRVTRNIYESLLEYKRDSTEVVPGLTELELVETLADRWGVHAGSTHVWFEIDRR